MKDKDFNDSVNTAYFNEIKKEVNGVKGYNVADFMDTAVTVSSIYADDLNNLIGTYIDSVNGKPMSAAEKAALYDILSQAGLKLAVNIISLNMKLGQTLALLLDTSDKLLMEFQEVNETLPVDQKVKFSDFLYNQFLATHKLE